MKQPVQHTVLPWQPATSSQQLAPRHVVQSSCASSASASSQEPAGAPMHSAWHAPPLHSRYASTRACVSGVDSHASPSSPATHATHARSPWQSASASQQASRMQPVHSSVASPAQASVVVEGSPVAVVALAAVVASVVGPCVVAVLVVAMDVPASELSAPVVADPLVVVAASVPDTDVSVVVVGSAPQASAAARRRHSGDRAKIRVVMSATMSPCNDIHFQKLIQSITCWRKVDFLVYDLDSNFQ
ncbi:hypothetical protein OV079_10665 [Nannocystis pusilla]|uniref:Uncharacterized protein n=1 Tax=Nannocystis pusilla TaxID=889268 RepID=A0A9X3EL53_9BACT|nr:hypothetical protein [Nannocystis pusilla]MCY1006017.1 hypothetical protein [Nannocystis pusilla]